MITDQFAQTLLTKNPYFNVSGITSSQANHICERIKETLKPIQDEISHLQTHTSSIDGEALDNFSKIEAIDKKLMTIGKLYAISAFFRSAIKEKERRLDYIHEQIHQIRDEQDKLLVPINMAELSQAYHVDMEDYLLTLPLADVITYKTAQARAAHIGKFIHNFDDVRQQLTTKERISLKEVGGQVFKIYHTPLYQLDELQSLQSYLLAEHRDHENIVNLYKARFHEFENAAKLRHEEELSRLQQERNALLNEKVQVETKKLIALKSQIASFKIVVPNEVRSMVDELLQGAPTSEVSGL